MKIKLFSATILALISLNSKAQNKEHEHFHDHHKNELGIAILPVYFLKEKEVSTAMHIHYIRKIGHSKFGYGLGYERIFDEHEHQTFGIVGNYRATDKLSFNASPGFTIEKDSPHANFALHLETTYEFEYKNYHFGPTFEFAYDKEDIHISLGLHIGLGF